MKTIKICVKNSAAIEAALARVNGRASVHSYTTYGEIAKIAERSEARIVEWLGAKWRAVGAGVVSCSSTAVAASYSGFRRAATSVTLECRATGWFLNAVVRVDVTQAGGGADRLFLSRGQADRATARLNDQFRIWGNTPLANNRAPSASVAAQGAAS